MTPRPTQSQWAVHLLQPEQASDIERLVELDAPNRFHPPILTRNIQEFIHHAAVQRAAGESYSHTVLDGTKVVGLCGLYEIVPRDAGRLWVWVNRLDRGRGIGRFAAENMTDFAFGPLRLERLWATANPLDENFACKKLLESLGFARSGAESQESFELTRRARQTNLLTPILRDLCPALRPIVEAELAAGNEIGECSRGWPERDSIVIAFRKPFRPPSAPLPANVQYREVNDTHWWKAEYASLRPVHLLTCGF